MRRLMMLSAGLIWSCLAVSAAAQDLPSGKEVVRKYIEATGGEAAYKKIKSMRATGKLSVPAQGISGGIEIFQADGKVYVEVEIGGLGKQMQGYDGEIAWESGLAGSRILSPAETARLAEEMDPAAALDTDKRYKSVETLGKEDVKGESCYKVEFTRKDDTKQTSYYSVKSGLMLKTEGEQPTALGPIKIESFVTDYQEVDGLKAPTKTEQVLPGGITQVIEMTKVTYNTKIDPGKFKLPEDIQKLKDAQK